MSTKTITFGELSFSICPPLFSGPSENRPADFSTEVRYKNIAPTVNVTKTTDPPRTSEPIKGAVIEGVPVSVVSQSEGATIQAIKKRCDHAVSPVVSEDFIGGHHALMDKIHEREEIRLDDGMIRAYLDEMTGAKRDRLAALLDSFDFTLPGYNDKTVFAKSEALLKYDGGKPRVVYQGGDMYNLLMGSVMFYLSRRIGEELSRTNPLNSGLEVLYCVGLTADEIAELVHHTPGEAVENDFKNNDGTQPGAVRKWESMFYYKLGAPKWFVREFASNTSVRIFTRYGVKGKVEGQRWSGEVTTTTGNGYVNACLSLAALKKAGKTRATIFVYGDDNLTYTTQGTQGIRSGFESVSKSIGMTAEVKDVGHRDNATFLRKRFARGMTKTFPVPSFGRVLAKLPIRANYNASVLDSDYMAGKCLSAAYEHRHIADLRSLLLDTAQQLSANPHMDFRNQAMAYKYTAEELRTMTSSAKVIDPTCYETFVHRVYGVSTSEVYDCYEQACNAILGYSRVNGNRGNRGKHEPPALAPLLPRALWSTALDALTSVDISL